MTNNIECPAVVQRLNGLFEVSRRRGGLSTGVRVECPITNCKMNDKVFSGNGRNRSIALGNERRAVRQAAENLCAANQTSAAS